MSNGVFDNEAFRKGKEAYLNGLLLEDNPYRPYTAEHDEWVRGMTEEALRNGVNPL